MIYLWKMATFHIYVNHNRRVNHQSGDFFSLPLATWAVKQIAVLHVAESGFIK